MSIEKALKDLADAVAENTRMVEANTQTLQMVIESANGSSLSVTVKEPVGSKEATIISEEQTKPRKGKVVNEEQPTRTVKDIVALCTEGQVTRDKVVELLAEFNASKLPELAPKEIPEFYDRLVAGIKPDQEEAA